MNDSVYYPLIQPTTDASKFLCAREVFLRYCTSDGYLGNRTGPLGWHFRGRSVLAATVEEMVALGMGSVPGTTLLYGGCSAGSRGASDNLWFFKLRVRMDFLLIISFLSSC